MNQNVLLQDRSHEIATTYKTSQAQTSRPSEQFKYLLERVWITNTSLGGLRKRSMLHRHALRFSQFPFCS